MAYTTINKSKDHFDGKIYLGSSSAVTVTGLEFQPDLVWVKDRDNGNNHCWVDAVRGVGKYIQSDNTSAEVNNSTNSISAFTSDGFTVGTGNPANESASTTKGFMSWNWKANGQGSSNTAGSINTTYTSVNTTAGFSICKWTGTGSAGTIGHGLGAVPKMIIIKDLSNTRDWFVYHASIGNNKRLKLNDNVAEGASTVFNNTTPTSSVFSIDGSVYVNNSGSTYIAYCFAEKTGYSKFGSYIGIANDNGAFVYTGFAPKFIMVKASTGSSTYSSWSMFDTARSDNLNVGKTLYANKDYQEGYRGNGSSSTTSPAVDLLSNGFKFRKHADEVNNSSTTYVYMAFGQSIVGSNNIPATAR
mgnify:FL=1